MQVIDLHAYMGLAILVAALVGLAIGSFITLITYRLPRDEKIGATRSRCTRCKTVLTLPDLVPVFSWVMLRGRCRHCGKRIGVRYVLAEILCSLGTVAIIYFYGELSALTIAMIGLWWTSIAIIITDLEHYLIMDEYQIALALFGLFFAYAHNADWMNVAIAVATGVFGSLAVKYIFLWVTKRDGLGMGDVKLFGVVGIWLMNAIHFAPLLVFAGVLGIISAIIWRGAGKGNVFPFGPAIILSLLLFVFAPEVHATFWQLYGMNMHMMNP